VLAALLAIVVFVGCGSNKGTGATDQDSSELLGTGDAAAGNSDQLATDVVTSEDEATSPDSGALPDPCADLDEAKASELVGFEVAAQPSNSGDDVGRICSFKNETFEAPYGGAILTVSLDDAADSLDEIHDTVANMTHDVEPVKVDIGEGGWYISETGFVELRFLIDGHQVGVNIVAPLADDATGDLSKQAADVAKVVESTLS
jgi:hypothetical protein